MAKKRTGFNPQAVQMKNQKKGKQNKKKKDEKNSSFFTGQEKEPLNTRAIRFAPRTAMNIFSGLFVFLFVIMCAVVLLTFGRTDTLARLAMSKQVNKTELIENVNKGLVDTEQMRYEGELVIEKLFTRTQKVDEESEWKTALAPYLSLGLSADDLGFSNTRIDRSSKEIKYIKTITVNEKEHFYRLYYDVRFTEGDNWKQAHIILPVCYKHGELKLIDRPQFTNTTLSESKNKVAYDESRFLPIGEDVSGTEKDKLDEFIKSFFELYTANDDKLGLISNAKGLEGGTLENLDIKTLIVDEKGLYHAKGTFSFYYKEGSSFSSGFELVIKPTKESYFVIKMNGE